MKKLMFFFVLFALGTSTIFAQKGQGHERGSKDQLARISTTLADAGFALSDRQTAQLAEIYTAQKTAFEAARATRDKSKMGELRKESTEKVSRILSAEQNQVIEAKMAARKENRKDGTGGYKPMPGENGKGKKGGDKDRFERMKKRLATSGNALTPDQDAKIDMLNTSMKAEMEQAKTSNTDDIAYQKAVKNIRKTYRDQADKVLTAAQHSALKDMKKEKKGNKKERKAMKKEKKSKG